MAMLLGLSAVAGAVAADQRPVGGNADGPDGRGGHGGEYGGRVAQDVIKYPEGFWATRKNAGVPTCYVL